MFPLHFHKSIGIINLPLKLQNAKYTMQKIFKGRGGNVITHTHIFPLHFDKDMLWMPTLWSPIKREETECLHCYCLRACICLYHMHSTRFHLNIPQQPFLRRYYRKGDKKCSPRVDYDNSYAYYSHTALFLQAHGFDQVTPTFARLDYSPHKSLGTSNLVFFSCASGSGRKKILSVMSPVMLSASCGTLQVFPPSLHQWNKSRAGGTKQTAPSAPYNRWRTRFPHWGLRISAYSR